MFETDGAPLTKSVCDNGAPYTEVVADVIDKPLVIVMPKTPVPNVT